MGVQLKNSGPHSEHQSTVLDRTGHWFLGFSTTRAGMENPAVPLDCFDSCNSPSFKGVNWQQRNGW